MVTEEPFTVVMTTEVSKVWFLLFILFLKIQILEPERNCKQKRVQNISK